MAVLGCARDGVRARSAGYSLVVWRHRDGDDEDGPPIFGHARIQATWITATAVIVLFLFGFGTYELAGAGFAGAGGGEGPSAIWRPTNGTPLQIQVIGQQWRFTYRYPQFGGFETTALMMPVNQPVQFNVTSLDVIHSFWAYQLGVKADANPGVNNVAFTTAKHTGKFIVSVRRAMRPLARGDGQLRPGRLDGDVPGLGGQHGGPACPDHHGLPPYAHVYHDPTSFRRSTRPWRRRASPGRNGYYYPPNDPVQP